MVPRGPRANTVTPCQITHGEQASMVDRLDFPDVGVRRLSTRHKTTVKAARRKERPSGGLLWQ